MRWWWHRTRVLNERVASAREEKAESERLLRDSRPTTRKLYQMWSENHIDPQIRGLFARSRGDTGTT